MATSVNDSATARLGGVDPERTRPVGLVPFLFGLVDRAELPGVVLNRLLVDLGLSPSAAKALLARMRHRGQLAATRRGRGVDYRLAGAFADSFERIRTGASAPPARWRGSFHALLYQVPEADRAFRDLLRRNAVLAGYGLLQQGVLIALTDQTEALAETLARRPPSATVYSAELRLQLPDARRAAAGAWALHDVERRYLRHCRDLRTALENSAHQPEPSGAAVRRLAELINGPMIDTLFEPNLPAELLPTGWPRGQLFELIGQVGERYGPAAATYARRLIDKT
jgi:phenylacetic acid degradation operon negative regulatory protein